MLFFLALFAFASTAFADQDAAVTAGRALSESSPAPPSPAPPCSGAHCECLTASWPQSYCWRAHFDANGLCNWVNENGRASDPWAAFPDLPLLVAFPREDARDCCSNLYQWCYVRSSCGTLDLGPSEWNGYANPPDPFECITEIPVPDSGEPSETSTPAATAASCSSDFCTSPGFVDGMTDCYAGNIEVEGQGKCSCSQGKAKTTGDTLNIPHVSEHTAPSPA